MNQNNASLGLSIIPALVIGIFYEFFLGHRHDYTGHFAAGYGGTYAFFMMGLRLIPDERYSHWGMICLVPGSLVCIAIGIFTEATIFRIAKFDEIDFFNQSLGAVLAAMAVLPFVDGQKPSNRTFDYGIIVAIVFLSLGGCFAVA